MTNMLMDLRTDDGEWRASGLCQEVDTELFFPEKGGSAREAKRVCAACEVRPQCLEFALEHDERFGIWGGLSERERRRLKRAAPVAAEPASDGPAVQVPAAATGRPVVGGAR